MTLCLDIQFSKQNTTSEEMKALGMVFHGRHFSMVTSTLVFLVFSTVYFFSPFVSAATFLPSSEVEALKAVGKVLGKTNWNFSADPCSGESGWVTPYPVRGSENSVTCNCSTDGNNNTVCHVVSIILKSQNLGGILPPELIRLPYLQEIDLTRNYLNGTIPPEWGSMPLVNISLLGNRLTGSIPKELGNISTLANLTLEHNQLSGVIPPELGNLPSIEKIFMNSNNLTGNLPSTLAKLTTLRDFRVGDNQLTGKIPDFIGNWTNLEKLVIQGSGLDGPIPASIALLTKLTDLRITNLNGNDSTFPPLSNILNLKTLILRSCNLIGPLPAYLGTMTKLKTLDLSFNKLNGTIPSSYFGLSNAAYIYLTGNMLSGTTDGWMHKGENIDLSFNNLTVQSNVASGCQDGNINLFNSTSRNNNLGNLSCLRGNTCSQSLYSLFINCGGGETMIDGKDKYLSDQDSGGPSKFVRSGNWAFSSTGHFLDDDRPRDSFIWSNTSRLYTNNPLYTSARLSPISLTYFAFCMGNGNYTVSLHFAEIMFTADMTFNSLGTRIFDIYVQGDLVQKDFNIENEAGGAGMELIKSFPAVVADNTLEIRLYYAGKGTTSIPSRGVYGPLISAISVNPDFKPPGSGKMSAGAVAGIVVAISFSIFLILGIIWWRGYLRCKDTDELDLKGLDVHTGTFTLRQIKVATKNFDAANKIGEGGFGPVYKGLLSDGTEIAVKQLSSKSKQGNREFVNEIGMISALQHPHLVKLYGCCTEGNQLLLVYEYLENNSLARALFGPEEFQLKLDWPTRQKICIGIARGLAYLHEESRLKIVHRDIKATNVLLDKNLNSKISDFGLAKLDEEEKSHITTRVAGTYGYMAPEYAMRGHLTDKADVYSFGIVTLEIISGRANTSFRPKQDSVYLLDWALVLKEKGALLELVDPRLKSYNKKDMMVMINLALQCTDVIPAARPTMSSVVSILEGKSAIQDSASDPSISKEVQMKVPEKYTNAINVSEIQTPSMSIDTPWTASSTSSADLYPENFESAYWRNRG